MEINVVWEILSDLLEYVNVCGEEYVDLKNIHHALKSIEALWHISELSWNEDLLMLILLNMIDHLTWCIIL